MREFANWAIAATVGASALGTLGIGTATAADIPVPYDPPRYSQPQPPPPEYYPPEEPYQEAPTAYVYPPPPPPVYRYYYPPVVTVVPPPVYGYYPYYAYRQHRVFRGIGPHIARGPYRHVRSFRRW